MKSLIQQARYFRSTGRKVVMTLAFASLINGLSISPALAAKDDGDDGRGQDARQVDHGQRSSRGDHEYSRNRPEHRRPYNYAQPVYVPPPVYDEPRQSPGISLFFPLDFRR